MLDLSRREAALLEELLHAAGRIVVKDTLKNGYTRWTSP